MLPAPGEERDEHPTPRCAELRAALISLPANTANLATWLRTILLLKRHRTFGFWSTWPSLSRPLKSRVAGPVVVSPRKALSPRVVERRWDTGPSLG